MTVNVRCLWYYIVLNDLGLTAAVVQDEESGEGVIEAGRSRSLITASAARGVPRILSGGMHIFG